MNRKAQSAWSAFLRKLRAVVVSGLVVVVPIGLTVWVMVWIFEGIENLIQPVIIWIFGRTYPGVGFGVAFVLIIVVGIIVSNVFGRRAVTWGEEMLGRVPLVRRIYVTLKEISQSFSNPTVNGFLQVVLVEFPSKGLRTVAFLTHEEFDSDGRKIITIFIPNAPNPMSGFVEIVREEEIIRTSIRVEDALRMVVSAGRISPKNLGESMPSRMPSEEVSGKIQPD